MEPVILPYAGTSGHSGSSTSERRAMRRDSSGKTQTLQNRIINLIKSEGYDGMTVTELKNVLPEHHGSVSGAASVLHKANRLSRLVDERGNCKIYVHPKYVHGRDTEEQGHTRYCHNCGAEQK